MNIKHVIIIILIAIIMFFIMLGKGNDDASKMESKEAELATKEPAPEQKVTTNTESIDRQVREKSIPAETQNKKESEQHISGQSVPSEKGIKDTDPHISGVPTSKESSKSGQSSHVSGN
jgi:hypothetical protein